MRRTAADSKMPTKMVDVSCKFVDVFKMSFVDAFTTFVVDAFSTSDDDVVRTSLLVTSAKCEFVNKSVPLNNFMSDLELLSSKESSQLNIALVFSSSILS